LKPPRWLGRIVTFLGLLLTWVLFRAESLGVAGNYFAALFGAGGNEPAHELLEAMILNPPRLALLGAGLAIAWLAPNSREFLDRLTPVKMILGVLLLFLSARVLAVQGFNPFLYFQF